MKTKARTIKNGSKTGILAAMLILSLVFSTSSCDGVNVIVDEDVPADNLPVNAMLYNDDYTLDDGPIKGGSARVHATPIDTLNPLLTQNTYTREIMGLIYEGLFEIDPQLEERPLLAYSYRVSEDGLTWTIDLKQNVKWHDGREFTSADVLYTVSMIQDYGDESVYAPLVTNISRIEAEGDHRVIIRLYKVNSFTPMALIFPIVPSHVPLTDGLYMEWMRISEILVGTGPYKAANYQFGESISLHINESWNSQVGNSAVGGGRFSYAMSGGSAGVNNSSEINGGAGLSNSAGVNGGSTSMNNSAGVNGGSTSMNNSSGVNGGSTSMNNSSGVNGGAGLNSDTNGDGGDASGGGGGGNGSPAGNRGGARNAALNPPFLFEIKFVFLERDDLAIKEFQNKRIDSFFSGNTGYTRYRDSLDVTTRRYTEREFEFIAFNTKKAYLLRTVRAAIAQMIDREKLVNDVLNGNGAVSDFPVQPESWLSDMVTSRISYDVQSARAMIEDAGYRIDNKVYSRPTSQGEMPLRFDLLVNSGRSDSVRAAENIAEQLSANGVRLNVVKLGYSEMMDRINNGNFDLAIAGFRVKTYPDMSMMYSTPYYDSDPNVNISMYQNDEVDRLVRDLYLDHDFVGRQTTFAELASIIKEEAPYIGLYFRVSTVFYRNSIKGYEKPSVWNPYGGIRNWYLADYF